VKEKVENGKGITQMIRAKKTPFKPEHIPYLKTELTALFQVADSYTKCARE
jgi:hypothetical protein